MNSFNVPVKEIEYNEQEKLLDARVIAMYENGETSYLDALLTSTSITDFLSKYCPCFFQTLVL